MKGSKKLLHSIKMGWKRFGWKATKGYTGTLGEQLMDFLEQVNF